MNISGNIDIIGDTHGIVGGVQYWAKKSDTPNMIHVGDYGVGFRGWEDKTKNLAKVLNEQGKYMFVIRGNHDDPIPFDGRFYGGENGGIFLVPDGTIATWNQEKILFNGGGISLDRGLRIPNTDYWEGEEFIPILVAEKIDYLVTHVSLTEITNILIESPFVFNYATKGNDKDLVADLYHEQNELRFWIEDILKYSKIKEWYFGHYHQSMQVDWLGTRCFCLNINEIRPFCRKEY